MAKSKTSTYETTFLSQTICARRRRVGDHFQPAVCRRGQCRIQKRNFSRARSRPQAGLARALGENILGDARNRYCDRELGEEIGWLISPFLNGFYYGYQVTHDPKWVGYLADWADAWIKRGVKEPDGFIGWPKSGSGGALADDFLADSLLGEAMGLRPLVLMAKEISNVTALKEKFGTQADEWLNLAGQIFEKWNARGCWREVKAGGLWVVPAFGIDVKTGGWTEGYARRMTDGFSNPDNKQNHIARWLLAMHDVTISRCSPRRSK